jgi:hypothetical protein
LITVLSCPPEQTIVAPVYLRFAEVTGLGLAHLLGLTFGLPAMMSALKEYALFFFTLVTFFAAPALAEVPAHGRIRVLENEEDHPTDTSMLSACAKLRADFSNRCQQPPQPNGKNGLEAQLATFRKLQCDTGPDDELFWKALKYESNRNQEHEYALNLAQVPMEQRAITDEERFSYIVNQLRRLVLIEAPVSDFEPFRKQLKDLSDGKRGNSISLVSATLYSLLSGKSQLVEMIPQQLQEELRELAVFERNPQGELDNICGTLRSHHPAYYTPRTRMEVIELLLVLSLRIDRQNHRLSDGSKLVGKLFHEMDFAGTRIPFLTNLLEADMKEHLLKNALGREISTKAFAAEVLYHLKPAGIPTRPSLNLTETASVLLQREGFHVKALVGTLCSASDDRSLKLSRGNLDQGKSEWEATYSEVPESQIPGGLNLKTKAEIGATVVEFDIPQADRDQSYVLYQLSYLCDGKEAKLSFSLSPLQLREQERIELSAGAERPPYEKWDLDGVRKGLIFASSTSGAETLETLMRSGFVCTAAGDEIGASFWSELSSAVPSVDYVVSNFRTDSRDVLALGRIAMNGTRYGCIKQSKNEVRQELVVLVPSEDSDNKTTPLASFELVQKALDRRGADKPLVWVNAQGGAQDTFTHARLALRDAPVSLIYTVDSQKILSEWIKGFQSNLPYNRMSTQIPKHQLPNSSEQTAEIMNGLRRIMDEYRLVNNQAPLSADPWLGNRRSLQYQDYLQGYPSRNTTEQKAALEAMRPGFLAKMDRAFLELRHSLANPSASAHLVEKIRAQKPAMEFAAVPSSAFAYWLRAANALGVEDEITPYAIASRWTQSATRAYSKRLAQMPSVAEIVAATEAINLLDVESLTPYLSSHAKMEIFLSTHQSELITALARGFRPLEKNELLRWLNSNLQQRGPSPLALKKILALDLSHQAANEALRIQIQAGNFEKYSHLLRDPTKQSEVAAATLTEIQKYPNYSSASDMLDLIDHNQLVPEVLAIARQHFETVSKEPTEQMNPRVSRKLLRVFRDLADQGDVSAKSYLHSLLSSDIVKKDSRLEEEVLVEALQLKAPFHIPDQTVARLASNPDRNWPVVNYLKRQGQQAIPFALSLLDEPSAAARKVAWSALEVLNHHDVPRTKIFSSLKGSDEGERAGVLGWVASGYFGKYEPEETAELESELKSQIAKMEANNSMGTESGNAAILALLHSHHPETIQYAFDRFKKFQSVRPETFPRLRWLPQDLNIAVLEHLFSRPNSFQMDMVSDDVVRFFKTLAQQDNPILRKKAWEFLFRYSVNSELLKRFEQRIRTLFDSDAILDGEEITALSVLINRLEGRYP